MGLVFLNCQDTLELEGKILEENTKITVPHRKIIVQTFVMNNNRFVPVYADEFFSDSSGCFIYSLRKTNNVYLYNFCVVGDSVYAFSNNRLGLTELTIHGKFLTFYMKKLTDFTIAFERKSITTFNDTLYVSWESDGINGKVLYPYIIKNRGISDGRRSSDPEFRWIGGDIESAIETKVYADKETVVHWELFRNGERKKITDTIFCKGDATNYSFFKY